MFNFAEIRFPFKQFSVGADIADSGIRITGLSRNIGGKIHVECCQFFNNDQFKNIVDIPFPWNKACVTAGISDTQIIEKIILLGKNLSSKEILQHCYIEMEKHVLCSKEDLNLDYVVLKETLNNPKVQKILCAAAKKSDIHALLEIANQIPLKINIIDINSRVIEAFHQSKAEKFFIKEHPEFLLSYALAWRGYQGRRC